MISHEKHQYFYEKYLRNEMPDNERQAFEEKLSADDSFHYSFHHYKNHRKQFLSDLLVEDETEAKKRWNLNSWIYLLISLAGIILAVNYYMFKDQEVETGRTPKKHTWNIFNRIPFLSKRNEPLRQEPPISKPQPGITIIEKDTGTIINSEPDEMELIPPNEETSVANDVMELDSFVVTYEKNYFDLRFKTIKSATDSILVDSLTEILAAKSAGRNAQFSKPVMVYVEFWRSPVNFRGYKFNGKKLVVYGINYPYEIYLLRDGDDIILRNVHNEFVLTRDNNFHKF